MMRVGIEGKNRERGLLSRREVPKKAPKGRCTVGGDLASIVPTHHLIQADFVSFPAIRSFNIRLVALVLLRSIMGKLNIAHHKSYHPYRRDNIERVRRDEEEARLKEAVQEGRMMLAVCKSPHLRHILHNDITLLCRILKPESTC